MIIIHTDILILLTLNFVIQLKLRTKILTFLDLQNLGTKYYTYLLKVDKKEALSTVSRYVSVLGRHD